MNNLFQQTSSNWVKYSEYEYRHSKDGILYITPKPNAKPIIYDPLKDGDTMVIDALNVGRVAMRENAEKGSGKEMKRAVMDFVTKYGLLGFMTALPTTAQFMEYKAVYLPKNHLLKEETMPTNDYVAQFFPFSKPDFYKDERTAQWNVSNDKTMMALMMTFVDNSMAMSMSLQREYAERYDWLASQFTDWAFSFIAAYLYYEDGDELDENTKQLYRAGISAFGGIAPTYRIALYEKPTIVWDFYSLLLGIQMMFSFMLTDEAKPIRYCEQCHMLFLAKQTNSEFCSPQCKNLYNVEKSRKKNKDKK
jgi:predicted nucleic acid-binding Zn ribbon protein